MQMNTTTEAQTTSVADKNAQGVVGVYDTMAAATEAVEALTKAGISQDRLSILTQNLGSQDTLHGFATIHPRAATTGAAAGASFGALFSLLSGAAFFIIPGLGPVMAVGAVVGPLVGLMEGAVGGAAVGGVVGAAMDRFVGKSHAARLEQQLRGGKYLVVVDSDAGTAGRARGVLAETGSVEVVTHSDAA
jgi:hypothetical protein